MKAIRINEHGGPEVLRYTDMPDPSPGTGQVVIRIEAAGVNFIDIYFRTGLYKIALPFTAGWEAAGVISAVGPDVTHIKPGDRVAYCAVHGAYAEQALVPADRLVKVPDGIETKVAAALMVQGMTAHYLTHSTFALKADHTALVHAAAGGVGLLLVQVAKMLGARVIGTCSTPEKAELVRKAGADDVILYSGHDFLTKVQSLTNNHGVDVVYDSVGKATWENSLHCLRPRGMLVFFGNASGPVPLFDPLLLSKHGSLFVTRPSLNHYVATRDELEKRSADLFSWTATGKLNVHIGKTLALADAAEAQQRLASRKTSGKVLLLP